MIELTVGGQTPDLETLCSVLNELDGTVRGHLMRLAVLAQSAGLTTQDYQVYETTRAFENDVRDKLVLPRLSDEARAEAEAFCREVDNVPLRERLDREIVAVLDTQPCLRLCILLLAHSGPGVRIIYERAFPRGVYSDAQGRLLELHPREQAERGDPLRFVCFYALCTYLRRRGQARLVNEFIRAHAAEFSCFKSYEHIRLESLEREKLTERNILEGYELVTEGMPDQAGVKMMFASMVAKYAEDHPDWVETVEGRKYTLHAITELSHSGDNDAYLKNYPKAHMIRAQLYAILHRYHEALQSTQIGIRLQREHEKDNDYMERLTSFYDTRVTIEVAEQLERIAEMSRKMEGMELKNLEILSIFAAVIGLITGGISLAGGGQTITVYDSMRIILVLFGAVTTTFTLFFLLSHTDRLRRGTAAMRRTVLTLALCFLCGCAMIGLGLLIGR